MSGVKIKIYYAKETGIKIQGRSKFIEWLNQFPDDSWYEADIKPIGGPNESNQRSLYFKWRDIIAEDLGWTQEDMHDYLKDTFNGGNSTKGMDTKQWSLFMTQVLAFASEHNINLPTGNQE
jgi:hypothetical protein